MRYRHKPWNYPSYPPKYLPNVARFFKPNVGCNMGKKTVQSLIFPEEIILKILSYLPEASTLFTIASLVDANAVNYWPWRDVQKLVNRPPLQLQKLIRFVLCERYGNVPSIEKMEHYLRSNLEGPDPLPFLTVAQRLQDKKRNHGQDISRQSSQLPIPPPLLILDRIHSPAKIIYEMNALSSDLDQLVQSFIG